MSLEEREVNQRRGELIKFIILVIFLLGTVLVVAVLSPFIFNLIVPSVLGWDQPAEQIEEPAPADDSSLPVIEVTVTTTPAPEATQVVVTPTATLLPPTATAQQYTVQRGDNLTGIANRFGVTVDALIQANQLTNPNQLMPGDVLLIPESP